MVKQILVELHYSHLLIKTFNAKKNDKNGFILTFDGVLWNKHLS